MKNACLLWLFLFCICLIPPAWAQVSSASLVGVISDPQAAPIPNVQVTARDILTGITSEVVTNDSGYYEFPNLPVGAYVITAKASGFQLTTTSSFELHAGTRPRIDLTLNLGRITDTVEVSATAPVVNATTTDLGVVIDSRKVLDLPLNQRNFTQLVALQNGITSSTWAAGRGGVAEFNGLPGLGNNWLMDGVDISFGEVNGVGIAAIGGPPTALNTISVDAIEEFKTTLGGFEAEYGRASGGVINITTRSGTNQFHGTALYFFRNNVLDANTFFNNRSSLARPELRHNQYGANLGGPILRNKLFFFFNYEGAKVRRGVTVSGNVATPLMLSQIANPALRDTLGTMPRTFQPTSNPLIGFHVRTDIQKSDELTTLSRLDYYLGQDRISFRLSWNEQTVVDPNLRIGFPEFYPIPFRNWTLSDTRTFSPTITNQARFGYNHWPISRNQRSVNPSDNELRPGLPVALPKLGFAYGSTSIPGLSTTDYMDLLASSTQVYTGADDFSWVHGSHTFKTGLEIRRLESARTQIGQGARLYYNSLQDGINDTPYAVLLNFGNPGRGFNEWTTGIYFQDEWKVNRQLQVNAGVRYEYFSPLAGSFGLQTSDPFGPRRPLGSDVTNPRYNNFGPRLGIVFDPTGKGKTVIRAGGAISYDPPQMLSYYDGSFVDPALPAFPIVNIVDLPASLKPVHFPFPESFVDTIRSDPSKRPAGLVPSVQEPDPAAKTEYSIQYNFTIQQAITPTFAVQASYVGNRAIHLVAAQLYNAINPSTGQRPRPDFGPVWLQVNAGREWYNGLQLQVDKRLSHNFAFNAYYTWSHTMAYDAADSGFLPSIDGITQDYNNVAGSIGPKIGEVRHRFTFVHTYQIPTVPWASGSRIGNAVLGGWKLEGIMGWRSGQPVNITLGTDVVGYGRAAGQRPDSVPGVSQYASTTDRLLWLNRAAYDVTDPTTQRRFGNLGLFTVRGPDAFTWDLGIHKAFAVRENQQITFRFEVFNWLNHPVLGNPVGNLSDPNFGRIVSSGPARNVQLGLKYNF